MSTTEALQALEELGDSAQCNGDPAEYVERKKGIVRAALAAAPAGGAEPVAWGVLFDPVYAALKDKDCLGASLALERVLSALSVPTAQPQPQPEPSQEFNRGWDAAIEAHRLPYGAARRQDHDWHPRELQEEHGEVTLPFAEFKRLVAAQPEAPAEPSGLANDWKLPGDFTCRGATFRKGVHVRAIIGRMERLYDAAYPGLADLTPEQKAANLAELQGVPAEPIPNRIDAPEWVVAFFGKWSGYEQVPRADAFAAVEALARMLATPAPVAQQPAELTDAQIDALAARCTLHAGLARKTVLRTFARHVLAAGRGERTRPDDAVITAWMERHNIETGLFGEMRDAFEDAWSWKPEADIDAAIKAQGGSQ